MKSSLQTVDSYSPVTTRTELIKPLHSRTTVIDFTLTPTDKQTLAVQFLGRLKEICDAESIKFDEKVLVELIMKFFPDFRRCLNEVQRYGVSGEIDTGLLSTLNERKTYSVDKYDER